MGIYLLLCGTFAHFFVFSATIAGVLVGVGLLVFVLSSILTIHVDRIRGTLCLTYRSLLTSKVKEIQLDQIASIDAQKSRRGSMRRTRLVITGRDGTVTPLRSVSRTWDRELQKRLWELTGVHGVTGDPSSVTASIAAITGQDELINREMRARQEAMTGSNEVIYETEGVTWKVQSIAMGRVPVTRWFSPDVKTNGKFVYIAQKSATAGFIGRLFTRGMLGRRLSVISMATYGFTENDAPGKGRADLLDVAELEPHFMALSTDGSVAGQILNASAVRALADWGELHSCGPGLVSDRAKFGQLVKLGQLVVLYSPNGVYAATIGTLNSSQIDELAATGVRLVNAQLRPQLSAHDGTGPGTQSLSAPVLKPRKKGCGCLSLFIGAVVLLLVLMLTAHLLLTRSTLPVRFVASVLAKSKPEPVIMTGISGSATSGFRIARIASGENSFEDVRLHTTGVTRMWREQEFIIHEIHVGKARITTEFLNSDSGKNPETGQAGKPNSGGNTFFLQMDRLSLNDMIITDRLTGTSVSIPKLEWKGFKVGKGQFDLGDLHVDSNMLTVRVTNKAPGRFRIDAALLPSIHKRMRKPVTIVADILRENNRTSSEIQAFEGALRMTDDADGNGNLVVKGLNLVDFIDGPMPQEIQIDMEMPHKTSANGERIDHLRAGSFRLGKVPFIVQPVDLARSSGAAALESSAPEAIIAIGKAGGKELRYSLTATNNGKDMNPKPLLTSSPPMTPEDILARIFHDDDANNLDAETRRKLKETSEWFRFSEN